MGPRAFAHGDSWWRANCGAMMPDSSMGPRAFAHGDLKFELIFGCGLLLFNGAAGFRPRRPYSRFPPWKSATCLQWGRGLSPTETGILVFKAVSGGGLQWGRGLSPTETGRDHPRYRARFASSMGPRAFAHGDAAPRQFGHRAAFLLQWGRGLSPTETFRVCQVPPVNLRLFNGAAGFRPRRQVGVRWS